MMVPYTFAVVKLYDGAPPGPPANWREKDVAVRLRKVSGTRTSEAPNGSRKPRANELRTLTGGPLLFPFWDLRETLGFLPVCLVRASSFLIFSLRSRTAASLGFVLEPPFPFFFAMFVLLELT